jgi:hypothetical protein
MTMTVSFVLVSPSMVMRLKDWSTAKRMARLSSSLETLASVVMKLSMVAMFGQIMPAPLAIPPTRKLAPLPSGTSMA